MTDKYPPQTKEEIITRARALLSAVDSACVAHTWFLAHATHALPASQAGCGSIEWSQLYWMRAALKHALQEAEVVR